MDQLWTLPFSGEQSDLALFERNSNKTIITVCICLNSVPVSRLCHILCPLLMFVWPLYTFQTGTWVLCSERRWVTLHFWSNCETAMVLCMCKATYREACVWLVNFARIIFVTTQLMVATSHSNVRCHYDRVPTSWRRRKWPRVHNCETFQLDWTKDGLHSWCWWP